MNPLIVFWRAGRDLFDELFLMIGLNLLWLLIAGPLFILATLLLLNGAPIPAAILALVNVLLFGPASMGLLVAAERIVDGRVASVKEFFEGMRTYRNLSWQVYGIWVAGLITTLFNLSFYVQIGGGLGAFLTVLFLYIAFAWSSLLIYLGPLILLQESKSLKLIWRNAAIMSFGRPIFTTITTLMMIIILGISVWFGILALLLAFAFMALWGMRATVTVIADDAERRGVREQQQTDDSDLPITERGRKGQIQPKK